MNDHDRSLRESQRARRKLKGWLTDLDVMVGAGAFGSCTPKDCVLCRARTIHRTMTEMVKLLEMP